MTGPGHKNEFAKKAKKMKIPAQMDNRDYGKKSTAVARNVSLIDTKTGQCYGTRTIMTKEEDKPISFQEFLAEADKEDITALPDKVVGEIKSNIGKGAKDLAQAWKNALELTNTAYHVSSVRLPKPEQKGAWKQYMDLIAHAVRQLSATRGIDGKWRVEPSTIREAVEEQKPIGKRRFFVRIPGEAAVEADAETLDDVIDQIASRIRVGKEVRGTKVRIELRDKHSATLGIYVNDVKRDQIVVQEIS